MITLGIVLTSESKKLINYTRKLCLVKDSMRCRQSSDLLLYRSMINELVHEDE